MESLCLPKINTKMPTRTKSVEMRKIVSNSEIHLHHCLCESRGFKIGKSNHRRCSVKKCSWKFCKIDRKGPMSESDTGFLLTVLRNFWEHFFYRTLPGDCFWWRGLMVKNFNSVSLIFHNSQLCRAPPQWWLLFWCNEEHFLIKETCLNFK